jgi:uncharacterized protein (TIGR02452 family)
VTSESTAQAARRLVETEGLRTLALNFASAKNPGGGFLGGAKAQEEDLARCSALYPCLLTKREHYDENRACLSLIYTDHIIYSPDVPFFRDERLELVEAPFLVSILTAPNAGEELRRDPRAGPRIRAALERRVAKVLLVAALEGQRSLVLGAWGCGVFCNDPAAVADIFASTLADPRFAGSFDRVVFAAPALGPGRRPLSAGRRSPRSGPVALGLAALLHGRGCPKSRPAAHPGAGAPALPCRTGTADLDASWSESRMIQSASGRVGSARAARLRLASLALASRCFRLRVHTEWS